MNLVFKVPGRETKSKSLEELKDSQASLRYEDQSVAFVFRESIYVLILNQRQDKEGYYRCLNLKNHVPRNIHKDTQILPVEVEIRML